MNQPSRGAVQVRDHGELRREAVGLREVLFQSITAMAPGAAIAASIPAGAAYAGGSLPLAVVLALFVATIIVLVIVGVYIACDLACIGYYLRIRRQDFNPLLHVVVPILGIVAFVPALLAAAGIQVFSFIVPLTSPASYSGIIVGVWLLIGVLYLGYLLSRHPARVAEMSRVHLDEDPVMRGDSVPA